MFVLCLVLNYGSATALRAFTPVVLAWIERAVPGLSFVTIVWEIFKSGVILIVDWAFIPLVVLHVAVFSVLWTVRSVGDKRDEPVAHFDNENSSADEEDN